jgi:hypothetical protein
MYVKDLPVYNYHIQHYGPLTKFGYKDFIPLFKGAKWDPYAWVELFKKAGLKYIVPVVQFHDSFAMYDCPFTRWNSVRMGPKRDVSGELAKAARENGLHFGVSYHFAEHWFFFMLISTVQRNLMTPLLTKPFLTTGLSVFFTSSTHTSPHLFGLIGGLLRGSQSLNLTFDFLLLIITTEDTSGAKES